MAVDSVQINIVSDQSSSKIVTLLYTCTKGAVPEADIEIHHFAGHVPSHDADNMIWLVVFDVLNIEEAVRFQKKTTRTGQIFLPLGLYPGGAFFGPVIRRGQRGCLQCMRTRFAANASTEEWHWSHSRSESIERVSTRPLSLTAELMLSSIVAATISDIICFSYDQI